MREQAQIIRWEDPPPPARAPNASYRGPGSRFNGVAAELATRPGEWALIEVVPGRAAGLASHIRKGHIDCFSPAGRFDAVTRLRNGKAHTYAKFIGADDA